MRAGDWQDLLTGVGFDRGAAYVQTGDDEQQPYPADYQVQQIDRWAARHELRVKEWFVDLGVDGDTPLVERAGGARLVEAARRGRVGFVVVATYSRLGHSSELILAAIQQLVRLRAIVIVIDGDMSLEILMAMEQVEIMVLGDCDCPKLTLN